MWRLPIPTLFPYTTLFRSHQALQPARLRVQRRQAHELSLDLFPVGQGVEQETLIPIDGRDELPLAPFERDVSIPGGKNHPALGVQGHFCCTAKHGWTGELSPFLPTFSHLPPL